MQGLPTNLLTKATMAKVGKSESSPVGGGANDNKVAGDSNSKGAFASLLNGLFGSEESTSENSESLIQTNSGISQLLGKSKIDKSLSSEGQSSELQIANLSALSATSTPSAPTAESKMDLLLKNKESEQKSVGFKSNQANEQVLSKDVLNNVQKLLDDKSGSAIENGELSKKVTSASDNLNALLKTLKGEELSEDGSEVIQSENNQNSASPLDFLLKKNNNKSESADSKNSVEKNVKSEFGNKIGLSGEEFISQLKDSKDVSKDIKIASLEKNGLAPQEFDPKALLSKQMNQSMKAYGQKQEMLGDGIIKNTKDLAFKESRTKGGNASIDELKSPDLKISNDLSHIKESFIPQMQKNESSQNNETNANVKVLDLSKINSSNTSEIIKRISDYVEQSQVANKDSLDLTVKHDALGQFKIQVNKPMGGSNLPMDMQITTTTAEGHDFFVKNEIGLMKNLSQAGIQLSDLRIVSSGEAMSFSQNDSKNSNNSHFGNQMQREFMSFDSGDSGNGTERRRELWQQARDNQQRFGA